MKLVLLLPFLVATMAFPRPSAPLELQQRSVSELIKRILPRHGHLIVVKLTNSSSDFFELSTLPDGRLHIDASSGVSAAAGLNHYLKVPHISPHS
jgi:hypothetical protein